ncbi:hypothetical protein BDR22DRAFT_885685 [Usnea florida]
MPGCGPRSRRQKRMGNTKIRKLQDYPDGFPRLSCFLDSDDAFMVYRRFGAVYARLLLAKQDEMSRMEDLLQGMDKTDEAEGNTKYLMSHTRDAGRPHIPSLWTESRTQLMERMEKKALEYAELLLKARQLKALDKPSRRDYKSVLHFMENDGGPLFETEAAFIYHKEDLVTLRPDSEYVWLDSILEQTLQKCRCSLTLAMFSSKETNEKTNDEDIHYYDRHRILICITLIITTVILVLLIAPVWLLYKFAIAGKIATSSDTIGVILAFTLMFSVVLSAFTRAKRHELVAASAGYCAVLVVFLGNVNSVSNRAS